jgi:excisionase family DNA binding protein
VLPKPPKSDEFVTSGEVAQMFGVSLSAVAAWSDQGLLPSIRTAGGHRRYRREDVDAFMRKIQEAS